MKYCTIFLFLLLSCNLLAQERVQIRGKIVKNDTLLENVHVRNISTGKFSLTGASGEFQLTMGVGDTLLFTHVGMHDLIAFIKKEDLERDPLIFRMTESSMELREVLIDETSEINVVTLGIIPKKIEKLSVNERRLRQAGDFKPKHLLGIIGGGVSIDAILNAINGRTKKLKRNISYEQKEKNITFLELHYTAYMKKDMELSDQEMRLLINHIIEDDALPRLISLKNEARLKFYLQGEWIKLREELFSDQ
ncbi:hypothetical protein [Salinimicrobium xinjiangense]|uniref:hypothetical protein n=1 Tax=Salinimicrobium xinjiangense TaxID=438596 RepID=UPI0004033451|nr:hypothetical protein [Salinimicrobium xinjiangense]